MQPSFETRGFAALLRMRRSKSVQARLYSATMPIQNISLSPTSTS